MDLAQLHHNSPAFAPAIPTAALPYTAALCLLPSFALAFYFSTLPKTAVARETAVASLASLLSGFGIVALFCSVGVYV